MGGVAPGAALQPTARSGDVVVRLEDAVIERQDATVGSAGDGSAFRLGPIDLEVAWQDRLGILGPNGSGKTTLHPGRCWARRRSCRAGAGSAPAS